MARKNASRSVAADSSSGSSVATLTRFRVALKGYPVMGFVEQVDGKPVVHRKLPIEPHYRPRKPGEALDQGIDDGWFTERQLLEVYGLDAVPEGWRKRSRVRNDLTGAIFEGAVVEAIDEHNAIAAFRELYGVNHTAERFTTAPAETTDQIGPYGPKKMRGLLAQS